MTILSPETFQNRNSDGINLWIDSIGLKCIEAMEKNDSNSRLLTTKDNLYYLLKIDTVLMLWVVYISISSERKDFYYIFSFSSNINLSLSLFFVFQTLAIASSISASGSYRYNTHLRFPSIYSPCNRERSNRNYNTHAASITFHRRRIYRRPT